MACSNAPSKLYVHSDVITCSICFDHFDDPKTLPCGHSLCLSPCLKNLSRSPPMLCPLCRVKIDMPPSGRIEDLPTNYVVKHLLETAEPHEEQARSIQEEEEEPVSWISTSKGNICQTHNGECEFFCSTCTAIVCAKCLLSTHKVGHHNIIAAGEYARDKIEELLETLNKVQKIDLEKYNNQGFSMRILQRMGRYYQKMPIFKEILANVTIQQKDLERLCGSLVEELCHNDFKRVKDVKNVAQVYSNMNKEYMKLENLYGDICTDLKRLKRVGMFAAVAVGLSFGLPLVPI